HLRAHGRRGCAHPGAEAHRTAGAAERALHRAEGPLRPGRSWRCRDPGPQCLNYRGSSSRTDCCPPTADSAAGLRRSARSSWPRWPARAPDCWGPRTGRTTAFWEVAAFGLVDRRAQHLSFGEFSARFAKTTAAAPWLDAPTVIESPPGTHPQARAEAGADVYALTHNETSTGVAMPVRRVPGADPGS